MKKKKTNFKNGDVVLHKDENKMFIIVEAQTYPLGKLYTLQEVSTNNDVAYKRYYADKISEKCSKIKNAKAVEVLFGKKK